jgi:hypothetical protein
MDGFLGFLDTKVKKLRRILSHNEVHKLSGDTLVITNPDAMEIHMDEDMEMFDELVDEVDAICDLIDDARRSGRGLTENDYQKIVKLFELGIRLEDLGITSEELIKLRNPRS